MARTGHRHRWEPANKEGTHLRCGDCKVVIEGDENTPEETKDRLAIEARRRRGLEV